MFSSRRTAFTLIELLVVIALVGIFAALAAPTYVGWRADSLNTEAVRFIEQAIATSRTDAKRTGTRVVLSFANGTTFPSTRGDLAIPNGGRMVVDGDDELVFGGALGAQAPFAIVAFDIVTGNGLLERTATVSVVPPLGKTAVVR